MNKENTSIRQVDANDTSLFFDSYQNLQTLMEMA
jgi:hypothetical protein